MFHGPLLGNFGPSTGNIRRCKAPAGLGHVVDQLTEGSKCAAQITVLCFWVGGMVIVCTAGICAHILLNLGARNAAVRAEIGLGTLVSSPTHGATVHFPRLFSIKNPAARQRRRGQYSTGEGNGARATQKKTPRKRGNAHGARED